MTSIRKRLADETGIAMIVVLGAITLVTAVAVGGFALASQAMYTTGRLHTEQRAFQVANTGMERELATFTESKLSNGSTYQAPPGTTPDGTYRVEVRRDTSMPFMYSIISTGTTAAEAAVVRQDFYFFDLWSTNVAAKNNPDMGPVGSASQWNGNSTISGPFYVGGDCDFNSNITFVGGPLFVSGNAKLNGGVAFVPVPSTGKYPMFAGKGASGVPSNVRLYNTCPKIDLPWVDPNYMDLMFARAKTESSDNLLGSKTQSNTEVTSKGNPSTYTGSKFSPSQTWYKVIDGDFSITGASPSFGSPSDDFAFDTNTDTLYVEGVVFVTGDVTIGAGVRNYQGSGVLISRDGNITVDVGNGNTFQPVGGDDNPDDLTSANCLALVAGGDEPNGDINLNGGTFEGIVFANGDFNIDMNGALHGAVHANTINSLQPHTDLFMETNMSTALLPTGTPGSPSDPRGANYGGGVVIPGSWSRLQ